MPLVADEETIEKYYEAWFKFTEMINSPEY